MKAKIDSIRKTLIYIRDNLKKESYIEFRGCFAKIERELNELKGSIQMNYTDNTEGINLNVILAFCIGFILASAIYLIGIYL